MISQEFIEKRFTALKTPPSQWGLSGSQHYLMDLRMCSLPKLRYGFMWGSDSETNPQASVFVSNPHRIAQIDVSFNDLEALDHEGLAAFRQLKYLDASLNRIASFTGIEVLTHLYHLNLSHNFIKNLQGLERCRSLVELNLSHNDLQTISHMPPLSLLRVLYVSNNKLRSIDGVQGLTQLRELHCNRNDLEDLLPASSCLQLTMLNGSENRLASLHATTQAISGLSMLQVLSLHGNPIETDPQYQSKLMRAAQLNMLDNVIVRPEMRRLRGLEPEKPGEETEGSGNISKVKAIARQAFMDQLEREKEKRDTEVRFLQNRIRVLQKDFTDYEKLMTKDLENCMRYMDTLRIDDVRSYTMDYMREAVKTPIPKPWHRPPPEDVPRRDRVKGDFTGIQTTNEVLRLAATELARDQMDGRASNW